MLLEKICKELGVEVGEIWEGNDGREYKIKKDGTIGFYYISSDYEEEFEVDSDLWISVMGGDLKPKWKPKMDDVYYTIKLSVDSIVCAEQWSNSRYDHRIFN